MGNSMKKIAWVGVGLLVIVLFIGCQEIKSLEQVLPSETGQDQIADAIHTDTNTIDGFRSPTAIAFDSAGTMYVANWSGGTVERITRNGQRSVLASISGSPAGLACDAAGFVYVSDYKDSIYRVSPSGDISVYAKGLHTPTGIAFNRKGDLLVTNRSSGEIVRVESGGKSSIIARGLHTPVGVVEHADGSLYVANYGYGITRIVAGEIQTISTEFQSAGCGIVATTSGEILAVDASGGTVKKITANGREVTSIVSGLKSPVALAFNSSGQLFVGTWGDGSVRRLVW
ncbi:NHL repeat-containing protein [Pelosinus baikalensis]|uniref:NHL repeat-containing protein n=1 Tax=Pelosinus baikalensis TaxID=2892015 RepID=A0ABS8HUN1_9FIRM|nr:NHL repeat-containing protein [Pelosinus baikalensis]MCC5466647.1 NHL repeat-containing protein [Pelosinus baikalensis]